MLAQALLTQATKLSALELVDGLKKCQEMAIRAALLPKQGGESVNALEDIRKQYQQLFGEEILAEGGANGQDEESVRSLDGEAGDGL